MDSLYSDQLYARHISLLLLQPLSTELHTEKTKTAKSNINRANSTHHKKGSGGIRAHKPKYKINKHSKCMETTNLILKQHF